MSELIGPTEIIQKEGSKKASNENFYGKFYKIQSSHQLDNIITLYIKITKLNTVITLERIQSCINTGQQG